MENLSSQQTLIDFATRDSCPICGEATVASARVCQPVGASDMRVSVTVSPTELLLSVETDFFIDRGEPPMVSMSIRIHNGSVRACHNTGRFTTIYDLNLALIRSCPVCPAAGGQFERLTSLAYDRRESRFVATPESDFLIWPWQDCRVLYYAQYTRPNRTAAPPWAHFQITNRFEPPSSQSHMLNSIEPLDLSGDVRLDLKATTETFQRLEMLA